VVENVSESDLTVTDIISRAKALLAVDLVPSDVVGWINECSSIFMQPIIKLEGYGEIVTSPGVVQYPLPDNVYENSFMVVRLNTDKLDPVGLNIDEIGEYEYRIWAGNIEVANPGESGTIKLYYFKTIAPIITTLDPLTIPNQYRGIYTLFICMKYYQKDQEPGLKGDYAYDFDTAIMVMQRERDRAVKARRKQWEVVRS
jgi:hypothetical protein